ncbi:MAG: cytochrome P450 [Granulosicoccaceae bacterium]
MPLKWTGPRQFSIDPRSEECFLDPYAIYQELHSVPGPVYWNDYDLWCLTSFEHVDSTLKSTAFARLPYSREQPHYPAHLQHFAAVERYSLLALEAPEHTRLRRSLNRSFVTKEINKLAPIIQQHANDCIDNIIQQGRAELLQDYAAPIPVRVIAGMLGVPLEESRQLLNWSHAMVKVYTLTQNKQDEVAADQAAYAFDQRLQNLITEKRKQPGDDLISSWIHEHELGDEEMISLAILLLNAGHEATVHQLGNAIKLLIEHPEHRTQLLESDKQADAVVAEALRFDPPLHLFTRYAQIDADLGFGVRLKKDQQVALLLAAANRDPTRFTNANQLDPKRKDGATLALGAGTHFCVGAYLSKLELRIALQVLFIRLPSLRLQSPTQYKDSFHFHGLEKLDVRWQ